ncbi:MAG TPA: hypothetical protein VEB66_13585 [Opitutaceae bacterium]|nr:hypothetical protein [Opitutaceae bacterium]
MPPPTPRAAPKPWPLKWVAAVIVVSVALYTFLTLQFRKPGPAYRPYQDAQDRATTARLLAGGWSRLPADVSRPADPAKPAATSAAIRRESPGLGAELEAAFAEKPPLLASVGGVVAPAEVARGEDYRAYFKGTLADQGTQLAEVAAYRRGNTVVLIPTIERLPDAALLSRWAEAPYQVRIPTQALPPGRYEVRLAAQRAGAAWSFSVR